MTYNNNIDWSKPMELHGSQGRFDLREHNNKLVNNIDFSDLKADGITDMSDVVQGIINYAEANKINRIVFPRGTYKFTKTIFLNSNTKLSIDWSNSWLKAYGNVNNFTNGFIICINSIDGINAQTLYHLEGEMINFNFDTNEADRPNLVGIKGIFMGGRSRIYRFQSNHLYNTITIGDNYIDFIEIARGYIAQNYGTDSAIISNNGQGDNWHIHDIETSSGNIIRLIRLSGRTLDTTIERIINGIVQVDNLCFVHINRFYSEVGQLRLTNCECLVENSHVYDNTGNAITDSGETLTIYPIVIKDSSGYSKDVILKNVIFTYPSWRDMTLGELKALLIADGYNAKITLDNCFRETSRQHSIKGLFNVHYLQSNGTTVYKDDATIRKIASGKTYIFPNKVISTENKNFFPPNPVSTLGTVNYIDLSTLPGESIYLSYDESGSHNQNGMKFFGASGNYTFRVFALVDSVRNVGFEIPSLNTNVIAVDNTLRKTIQIALNFDTLDYEIVIYAYKEGVLQHQTQFKVFNNSAKLYYNGSDTNSWFMYAGGERGAAQYYPRIEKINNNLIVYGSATPTSGTWQSGDIVYNTTTTSGQVIRWRYNGTAWVAQGVYA